MVDCVPSCRRYDLLNDEAPIVVSLMPSTYPHRYHVIAIILRWLLR